MNWGKWLGCHIGQLERHPIAHFYLILPIQTLPRCLQYLQPSPWQVPHITRGKIPTYAPIWSQYLQPRPPQVPHLTIPTSSPAQSGGITSFLFPIWRQYLQPAPPQVPHVTMKKSGNVSMTTTVYFVIVAGIWVCASLCLSFYCSVYLHSIENLFTSLCSNQLIVVFP